MQYLYFSIEGVLEEGGGGGCDARRFPSRLQHSVGFLRWVPVSMASGKRYSGKGDTTFHSIVVLFFKRNTEKINKIGYDHCNPLCFGSLIAFSAGVFRVSLFIE